MSVWSSSIVDEGSLETSLVCLLSGHSRAILRSALSTMESEYDWESGVDWDNVSPLIAQACIEIDTEYQAQEQMSEIWIGSITEYNTGNCGNTSANNWVTRAVSHSEGDIATPTSNYWFVPETGTYRVSGWTVAYQSGYVTARIADAADTTLAQGATVLIANLGGDQQIVPIEGMFTISASIRLYMQLYATLSVTNGQGKAGSYAHPTLGRKFAHLDFFLQL